MAKTILGTTFECSCGKRFVAGTAGMEALTERVRAHVKAHMADRPGKVEIRPLKPKKGMFYVTDPGGTQVGEPYDGKQNPTDWYLDIASRAVTARTNVFPSWTLA